MRLKPLYTMAIALTAIVFVSYGNSCSRVLMNGSALNANQKRNPAVQDGSGQTYDGKVYQSLMPTPQVCPDGSPVRTQLRFGTQGVATLVRQACLTLAQPQAVLPADLVYPPEDSTHVIYQNEILTEASGQLGRGFSIPAHLANVIPKGWLVKPASLLCLNSELALIVKEHSEHSNAFTAFMVWADVDQLHYKHVVHGQASSDLDGDVAPAKLVAQGPKMALEVNHISDLSPGQFSTSITIDASVGAPLTLNATCLFDSSSSGWSRPPRRDSKKGHD